MERLDAEQDHKTLYEEFVALCEIADKGGMHAIWTGEHHGMDFTIAPNPFITIADLARRTTNVRLGTGTVIAPFWHPIKLAGEAAMTDLICDGRLISASRAAPTLSNMSAFCRGSTPGVPASGCANSFPPSRNCGRVTMPMMASSISFHPPHRRKAGSATPADLGRGA